jgi:hypothetical protein
MAFMMKQTLPINAGPPSIFSLIQKKVCIGHARIIQKPPHLLSTASLLKHPRA